MLAWQSARHPAPLPDRQWPSRREAIHCIMDIDTLSVQQHYAHASLLDLIVGALERGGKNLENLSPDDLAPIDEFHTRGRTATVELAKLVAFGGTENVLDVGSGLGGPSRFLAKTYGCRVTGIDLTPQFVAVAEQLTRLTRLSELVSYRQADARSIPFEAATFDVVWSQNVAMNIADRARLYAEIRRVLRPGGKYALSDIVRGAGGEPYYPMPWARTADTSYLLTEEATRLALERAGFAILAWENTTEQAIAAAVARAGATSLPPLGLHLLFGTAWPTITANQLRNYREGRTGVIHGVLARAD
jgi:SAM-dependent methyltransferase